uniref:Olfactory receptor n=1 Tax=Naja naja TaxID=35670 RepID=A0A8C6XDJ2_NAJNA
MANESIITEFLLMGFSDDHDIQILYFVMFLIIYLLALMGNVLLLVAVILNHHLHSPMYFFLVNLSFSDVCFISTMIPKAMAASLTNNRQISYAGCAAQVFSVFTFGGSELSLLTVMAYDRYVAICHPLQYTLMMNWDACLQMAAASWISNLIHALLQTILTFRLNFCKFNIIEQFFCDIPHLQKISYIKINQILIWIFGLIVGSFCVGFIFASYGYIISAVLRIPSVEGRHKAFSTCSPHLTVFSLFMSTAFFSYLRPKSLSFPIIDLLSAVAYTVLPPILNPIIYCLRNKDIQGAVWKITSKIK